MAFRQNFMCLKPKPLPQKNKKNMRIVIVLLIIFISKNTSAQKVLKLDDFLELISKNHPIAKQAQIRVDMSAAAFFAAKGVFDPVLTNETAKKTLDGKIYYNYQDTELKVYTPIGLTAKTGIENSNGMFSSNERTIGNLGYIGLEMPVLKGLLIDYQRAILKQSAIYQKQSEEEKRQMLNDLYLDAIQDYWQWTASYQNMDLLIQNLGNAKNRLNLLRIAFQNGDKSMNDTLEAYTQVQNIELLYQEAQMEAQTSAISLAKYLWNSNDSPYFLESGTIPDIVAFGLVSIEDRTEELISLAKNQHPELGVYRFKMDALAVERTLKRQSLLPTANLKMNILSKNYYNFESAYSPFLNNNYKFGFDFKMPLFLREARGDYQKTLLKISETNSIISNKTWEIENKIRSYGVEQNALKSQLNTSQSMIINYRNLLKNEEFKLQQGESTLFLINSRENKWIESLLKNQSLKLKYLKSAYKQLWAAGVLVK
ncbi:TolC family protein [Lacihabitans sp. CS3-21]|nr:TolC family protein [Lacihabitans sp. CS3-21]